MCAHVVVSAPHLLVAIMRVAQGFHRCSTTKEVTHRQFIEYKNHSLMSHFHPSFLDGSNSPSGSPQIQLDCALEHPLPPTPTCATIMRAGPCTRGARKIQRTSFRSVGMISAPSRCRPATCAATPNQPWARMARLSRPGHTQRAGNAPSASPDCWRQSLIESSR
jgi:hypothetical protein